MGMEIEFNFDIDDAGYAFVTNPIDPVPETPPTASAPPTWTSTGDKTGRSLVFVMRSIDTMADLWTDIIQLDADISLKDHGRGAYCLYCPNHNYSHIYFRAYDPDDGTGGETINYEGWYQLLPMTPTELGTAVDDHSHAAKESQPYRLEAVQNLSDFLTCSADGLTTMSDPVWIPDIVGELGPDIAIYVSSVEQKRQNLPASCHIYDYDGTTNTLTRHPNFDNDPNSVIPPGDGYVPVNGWFRFNLSGGPFRGSGTLKITCTSGGGTWIITIYTDGTSVPNGWLLQDGHTGNYAGGILTNKPPAISRAEMLAAGVALERTAYAIEDTALLAVAAQHTCSFVILPGTPNTKRIQVLGRQGTTYYAQVTRESDGARLGVDDGEFHAVPYQGPVNFTLVEDAEQYGVFRYDENRFAWQDDTYIIMLSTDVDTIGGSFGVFVDDTLASGTATIDPVSIADAVWDEIMSGHVIDGSAGQVLASSASGQAFTYFTQVLNRLIAQQLEGSVVLVQPTVIDGLTLYQHNDYPDFELTLGPQWSPYLDGSYLVYFTIKKNFRDTTSLLETRGSIVDQATGALRFPLTVEQMALDMGNNVWQVQLRKLNVDPDLPPDSVKVAGFGHVAIRPTLKPVGAASVADEPGMVAPLTIQNATYAILTTDYYVLGNGTFTMTLPTAIGVSGKKYQVKNVGTGVLTLVGSLGQTIDGQASQEMDQQYENLSVVSDGSNWVLF